MHLDDGHEPARRAWVGVQGGGKDRTRARSNSGGLAAAPSNSPPCSLRPCPRPLPWPMPSTYSTAASAQLATAPKASKAAPSLAGTVARKQASERAASAREAMPTDPTPSPITAVVNRDPEGAVVVDAGG
jgi:hypothetical protein